MDAKEYLTNYAALKMEAQNNENRILQAFNDTLIPAMRPSDGSQKTPSSGNRQESANIRYLEIKERLQPQIDANKAEMREIEDTIDLLPDRMEREVLRLRYIDADGWKPTIWREVAVVMYRSDEDKNVQQVQRIHRKAIEALDVILAAKEESHQ